MKSAIAGLPVASIYHQISQFNLGTMDHKYNIKFITATIVSFSKFHLQFRQPFCQPKLVILKRQKGKQDLGM